MNAEKTLAGLPPSGRSGSESMTTYQKAVVGILAFLQLTIILDFMILAPLGAMLLDDLNIDTKQFGLLVSAYAVSAGASGFATAGFADKLDRKKLLLFFYTGFIAGTALCGVAPTYEFLLGARIVAGIFGGVIGSISMAIIADLFPLSMRGRVMGTVQTAFSVAQVAGLPAGLALASWRGWHAPFLIIAGIGAVAGVVMAFVLRPIDAHLNVPMKHNAYVHMLNTVTRPTYLRVFGAMTLLASGFMLMPLLSAFFVNNLHIELAELPIVYMVTGAFTFFMGPLAGKLADRVGKYVVFTGGSLLAAVIFAVWANLSGPTSLWLVVVINVSMFVANTARMISAAALTSAVPALADRGAFMSIAAALQQVTGGVAAFVGGLIVTVQADGALAYFDTLCYVVVGATIVALLPMWIIDRQVKAQQA